MKELSNLANIGALLTFAMVGVSVIILRKTHPKITTWIYGTTCTDLADYFNCMLSILNGKPTIKNMDVLRCLVSNRSSCILCLFEKHSHLKDDGSSQDNLEQAN